MTTLKPLTVWIITNHGIRNTRPLNLSPEKPYAGQEATVRARYGKMAWFKLGKGVHQGCVSSSCLFNLYAEYIMQNVGLEDSQAGVKIAGRNTATSDMHMIPL